MRLVSSVLVVLVASCNQLYGLDATQRIDAAYFDAPIDAPFRCPAFGQPLRFSTKFQQAVLQDCTHYSVSLRANRALAVCDASQITEGTVDGTLTPAIGLPIGTVKNPDVQLGPDGDLAVIASGAPVRTFQLAHRTESGWVLEPTTIDTGQPFLAISTPTRGPSIRVLALAADGLHELVLDPGQAWRDVGTHTRQSLRIINITNGYLNLSADGLRLVFAAASLDGTGLLLSDRASIGAPFSPARLLAPVDFLGSGFVTEDCERLYFSSLGSVWFAPRE